MATETTYRPAGTVAIRMFLTLLGAAGLILGSFLDWAGGTAGTDIENKVFWSTNAGTADFIKSAGVVTIVIGLLALLGLAARTGWLTRLAGALGVVAFVTFVITLYRIKEPKVDIGDVQIGMWLVLAGAVLALIAGFFGDRTVVTTAPAAPVAAPPPPTA
jgi:hypothetical protein